MLSKDSNVLVVGAGCFGISTAYHLLKRGYTRVTIIDRGDPLPAVDAASTDMNKIVRTSYADPFYAKLAKEAIAAWKEPEWRDTYHECGVLIAGRNCADSPTYADSSYEVDKALGSRIQTLDTSDEIKSIFPSGVDVGDIDSCGAYFNRDEGWAYATQGVEIMTENVRKMGGILIPGKEACGLIRKEDGATTGVRCRDEAEFTADYIVLATGSWTPSSFPKMDFSDHQLATGQSIAKVQLSEDEAKRYQSCPVVVQFGGPNTGFYVFPPNTDNVVKLAIHHAGYTYGLAVSTPRTVISHPEDGLRIPKEMVVRLRQGLKSVYPGLAKKAFIETRMCWYNDSPDGNWIIGFHPKDESLLIATAGCGHGYKFLPVIGRLIADALEGILPSELKDKFSTGKRTAVPDLSRPAERTKVLLETELSHPEDL